MKGMSEMALMKCPECGNEVSDKAEMCPNCGYKIEKKEVKAPITEVLCFISLIIACFCCLAGFSGMTIGYLITLFWLAIYESKYNKYKKDGTVDYSTIKKTRDTIIIFLILQFGIVIIF